MAAATPNPYLPPQSIEETQTDAPRSWQPPQRLIHRRIAFGWLAFAIIGSMFYVYVDIQLLELGWGPWPLLVTTAAVAFAASVRTRDWVVAPLCCFLGTMSGDILAGFLRSWNYAAVPTALGLAACFSVPAFIAAVVSLMIKRRT